MSIVGEAKAAVQGAAQKVMQKAVEWAPDRFIPGGEPDPLISKTDGTIGQPVHRLEGPLKIQGRAAYSADVDLPNMVYAALVFSTIAKGRIASLDTAAAEALDGVVLVMTHRNAPRMAPTPLILTSPQAGAGDCLPVMQDDAVYWNGQPVAVVLAETQEQADLAASLVRVAYNAEDAVTSSAAAKERGTEPGNFLGKPMLLEIGDAEAALASSAFTVDQHFTSPRHNHNAIELNAATLTWEGDKLIIHGAVRGQRSSAWSLAQVFGIDEAKVEYITPFVGGAFGGKLLWWDHVLGAAAAKLAGRPVRIMLSREGVYRVMGGRSPTEQRVAIGADRDGKFTAIIHSGTTFAGGKGGRPEPFINPTFTTYAAETFKLDVQVTHIDMIANTFMRAPGESVGSFALESAIDELAEAMEIDPIELRVRNEPEKDPTSGKEFSSRHLVEAYRAGAERFGWDKRGPVGGRCDGEWQIGMGVATGAFPYFRFPGGVARMTLSADGTAHVAMAADELGIGSVTVSAQMTADRLGLAVDQVTVANGDSALPGFFRGGGSQQTAAIGGAIMAAHDALVAELLKCVGNDSPLAGLKPDEVCGIDGGLAKVDDPGRHESYVSILRRAGRDEVSVEAEAAPSLEFQHWSMHSHSAIFCEARVNMVTGEVRVDRLLGSYDCGRILNPRTAASQFRGGMIMSLGMALMEETLFDERNGRIMNPSLAEYHVAAHLDVPEIDLIWTDIPDPHSPMGARGVGEIGMTGVGAAIANAIYNATGKRVRDLPITLDKLL